MVDVCRCSFVLVFVFVLGVWKGVGSTSAFESVLYVLLYSFLVSVVSLSSWVCLVLCWKAKQGKGGGRRSEEYNILVTLTKNSLNEGNSLLSKMGWVPVRLNLCLSWKVRQRSFKFQHSPVFVCSYHRILRCWQWLLCVSHSLYFLATYLLSSVITYLPPIFQTQNGSRMEWKVSSVDFFTRRQLSTQSTANITEITVVVKCWTLMSRELCHPWKIEG